MSIAEKIQSPLKKSVVIRNIGGIFIKQSRIESALKYYYQAMELQPFPEDKTGILFAVAHELTKYKTTNPIEIVDLISNLAPDLKEQAIFLIITTQLLRNDYPELVFTIGESLRYVDIPIKALNFPKRIRNRKKLLHIHTVGELLASIVQRKVDLSQTDSAIIERILRKSGFWPQAIDLFHVGRYEETRKWSSGGGGCFPEGTRISLTKDTICEIDKLKVKMPILCMDENSGEFFQGTIKTLFCGWEDSYYKINNVLRVTGTHEIYTSRGWLTVNQLRIGDNILNQDGQKIVVNQLQKIEDMIRIYNLKTEAIHTFFAERILVHNPRGWKGR